LSPLKKTNENDGEIRSTPVVQGTAAFGTGFCLFASKTRLKKSSKTTEGGGGKPQFL
jgi:hypothetical protein